jgi:hypothetical protein
MVEVNKRKVMLGLVSPTIADLAWRALPPISSMQSKERQDRADHHDKPNDVDDTIHVASPSLTVNNCVRDS